MADEEPWSNGEFRGRRRVANACQWFPCCGAAQGGACAVLLLLLERPDPSAGSLSS